MMTYNPLERASIALSQIGVEAALRGMPDVQRGLDCLACHLERRAGDADEQIADGLDAAHAMAHGLHDAVVGAVACTRLDPPDPPALLHRWPLRLAMVALGVGCMWLEGSVQPSPGVGFAVGMCLIVGSALFGDREPR